MPVCLFNTRNVVRISIVSGKCEMALFGDYVDHLKQLMAKVDEGLPVLVVQFAKVKIFRGCLYFLISNTRLFGIQLHAA
jgi:hypothetical protein